VAQNGTNRLTRQDIGRTHFGEPVGSGSGESANAAVPDPTWLAMLVVAAGLCLRRRLPGAAIDTQPFCARRKFDRTIKSV
jgi:hypothetical protein